MHARTFTRAISLLALSLLLAACLAPGYVKDPTPWLTTADWPQAERARVVLSEYAFTPQVLSFTEGRAYVLEIANKGKETHDFVSERFFRAIATRKARMPEVAELEAPYFTDLEVHPGGTVELHFVAVRPGTYDLSCTVGGHAAMGMKGAIRILPKPKASGSPNR